MDFEFVKIEGQSNPNAVGRHWFTVSECKGHAGCLVSAVGFALTNTNSQFALPLDFALIGHHLIYERGLKQGQRAIVRIKRTYPRGETVYFRFSAQ
jgi:hypothetical protein